ncbi:MAG: hypothetical protein ACQETD_10165 [Pseudomonadota bacterium]
MPHLLVAISPHGFGHLAQVAPVLRRLRRRLPGLRLTLRTTLPPRLLAERIGGEFALQAVADDFGMVQQDALRVDVAASLARYRALHADWEGEVARVAAELEATAPDLIFADVPYLTLAAAERVGIPAVAMCSLNWHAILAGYLDAEQAEGALLEPIRSAYAAAECFLRPEPSMPMPGLDNLRDIGVVTEPGVNRRRELLARGLLAEGERLVLVALGGIAHRLPLERWPVRAGLRFAVPASWGVVRRDCVDIEACGLAFSDLLASADAVLGKPGYGTFTEAAINGVPLLYLRRGEWPEEPVLLAWLQRHGRCAELSEAQLASGAFVQSLEPLWRQVSAPLKGAHGAEQAADVLAYYLEGE